MDIEKVMEAVAPPQDCATCEHLNLDQTMPLTDPPIPIAYCPIACDDADEGEYDMEAASYWAHETACCPAYSREKTKDELKDRITELEQELEGYCEGCERIDPEDYQPEPPDHSWRD